MTPRLFFLLSTAYRAVRRSVGRGSPTGPSGAQAGVLFQLQPSRAILIGTVAKRLEASPSSMTELIDRMVVAGLVTRSADDADGRSQRLTLTVEGEAARNRAVTSLSELNVLLTDGFSSEDIDTVARWLEAVRLRFANTAERSRDEHPRALTSVR